MVFQKQIVTLVLFFFSVHLVACQAATARPQTATTTDNSPTALSPASTPVPTAQVTPTSLVRPQPTPTKTRSSLEMDNQSGMKLAAIGEIPCCPRWSPDGQKIAFAIGWGLHKGIYVVNREGGNLKRLVYMRRAEGDSPPIMPTWTDDSQHILYREGDGVFIVPVDGNSNPQPYHKPNPPVPAPVWLADYQPPSPDTQYNSQLSPDEQYLAIVRGYDAPRAEQGLYLKPMYPLSATPQITTTLEPPLANAQTYTDPLLNFSLRYPTAWTLEARDGTNLNDGSGRTISLEREDYLLEIKAQFRPEEPGKCTGRFPQENDSPANYWHYQVDGVAVWRAKVEDGHPNSYHDESLTFIDIISPTELADTPNSEGVVGHFVCTLEIGDKLFAIDYRLPLSLEAIEGGRHQADILAEMDDILQSIIWNVAGEPPLPTATPTTVPLPQPTITPTPPGYDATVTVVPGEPTPDEISRIKAANANQPEIRSPLLTPGGEWQAKTTVYGCIEIGRNQVLAYEELILTHLDSGTDMVVASQQQNCGGLGAAGLAALFWSPTTRYLYYTDARDGVADGCGFQQPPILRWDRTTGQTDRLGGGVISPDGTRLVMWQQRDLVLWELDQGEVGRIPAAADAFPGQIAWSPESQAIVYLQVSSYCPLSGPSFVIRLDANTLEQSVLLESEQPVFHRVTWNTPGQLHLIDENEQAWTFQLDSQTLEPMAQNETTPNSAELAAAAMDTVIAFNQTDGVRDIGPFLEIPSELWAAAIADLQSRRVYWHQNNLAVVLTETDTTEEGVYIGVPISSYVPENNEIIEFVRTADNLFQFTKKRSD